MENAKVLIWKEEFMFVNNICSVLSTKLGKIIYLSLSQNTFETEHWNVSEVMFDCITLPSKF